MSIQKKSTKYGLALTVLAVLIAAGGYWARKTSAATTAPEPAAKEAASVVTIQPTRQTLRRLIEQPGQIDGFEHTAVFAKISGYVQKWNVDIGDVVYKDQILAELSIPETVEEHAQKVATVAQNKAEVTQAQRLLTAAEANLKKMEASVRLAEATRTRADAGVVRWKSQYERDRKLVSSHTVDQQSLEQTIDQFRSAEAALAEAVASIQAAEAARAESAAQVEKAKADVAVAEARLLVAQADERRLGALVEYATIRAPFAGVITRRNVDTGHLLQPTGAQAMNGVPLFTVVRTDPVRIFVDVPEGDAPLVKPGTPARVRVPALQEREFVGQVTRSSWVLDTQARTLRTQIDLPNPDGLLRPGMYATAQITAERPDTLTVPASAVLNRDDQWFVYRVVDGKAVRMPVKVGQRQGALVEVLKKQPEPAAVDGRRNWESFTGKEELIGGNLTAVSEGQLVRGK